MKRFLFWILSLLLFNCIHIDAINDVSEFIMTNENGEKSFTVYAHYFIIKEYCKFLINYPFMLLKFNRASIYCCKSHHKNDASRLWAYLIFKFDESLTNELKNHIYNDSTEELTTFVLQKNQEFQLHCRECGEYSGYYVPEQLPSSQKD